MVCFDAGANRSDMMITLAKVKEMEKFNTRMQGNAGEGCTM